MKQTPLDGIAARLKASTLRRTGVLIQERIKIAKPHVREFPFMSPRILG
jgi:hypothetical protein